MIEFNRKKNNLRQFHLHNEIVIAMVMIILSGCVSVHWKGESGVVQHGGILWYSLIDNENARIFLLKTLGLQLRFQMEDPGFNLGYRKYIALKPPIRFSTDEIINSGFFWVEDSVSDNASLQFKKQLGLEIGGAPLTNGLSLGYDQITVVQGPPNGGSVVSKIDFFANDLQRTRVFQAIEGIHE